MNKNTIKINSYLQNQMSAEEKAAFENQLAIDPELQQELLIQQQIIQAALNAGIKTEFAKAIRREFLLRQVIKWGIISTVVVTTTLFIVFRQHIFSGSARNTNNNVDKNLAATNQRFINPPLAAIDVPFSIYSFDAAKGYTIFHPTGSVLFFPANAFVDAGGNLVKGIVNVSYREFTSPVDFFVSGIPMGYDSAGKKYNFESSGMCEVKAYQNNTPLFVNQQSRPQINLSTNNKSPLHNLYVLDTVSRNWVFVGKDKITEVKQLALKPGTTVPLEGNSNNFDYLDAPLNIPTKPIKPVKAIPGRQAFSVAIDDDAFEELRTYDKQRFEVAETKGNDYHPSDADEHWDNVKLDKTPEEGIYLITFTNKQRTVSYKVKPVLAGDDYAAALKIFNEKNQAYEEVVENRKLRQLAANDSMIAVNKQLQQKWNEANEWNNKMNELIIARNKKIKALRQQAFEKLQQMGQKSQIDMSLNGEIIRTFAINKFGIWNCDHPQYPDKEMYVEAIYTSNADSIISLPAVAVVYKGFNGIAQFPWPNSIRVILGSENMILGIKDEFLYYYSYKDFMSAGINSEKRKYIFKMHRSAQVVSSYEEIKQLIAQIE